MLVSILINNRNYGRFLEDAIESALGQTYREVEIVVVDDGSTDESREIVARYGDRIVAVLKENGGQGSAFNAGFAASRGAVVMFLDSDDFLLPDAAKTVVEQWRSELAKVHFPMVRIDEDGCEIGREPKSGVLPSGLVWQQLVDTGRYLTPACTGSAYARWALERVLPVPEADYVRGADAYLNNSVVFCGEIRAIEAPLACYRIHGKNSSLGNVLSTKVERIRYLMGREVANDRAFAAAAQRNGLSLDSEVRYRYYQRLKLRVVSWKLDRAHHPKHDDRWEALFQRSLDCIWRYSELSFAHRVLQTVWFGWLLTLPQTVVQRSIGAMAKGREKSRAAMQRGQGATRYWVKPTSVAGAPAPAVSVVITNYNYARFVTEAIESVLRQSSGRVEVVVVDDGSTDNSREVLEPYRDRVELVFQANGGQGAAFNAGFARTTGDIVIFLDADDLLDENAIERLIAQWDHRAVKTHFVMRRINDRGETIGTEPRNHAMLPEGGLWKRLIHDGRYLTTATSGNAYARWALERVLPMPAEAYRLAADAYLNNCIVFHGPVQAINEPLASYRIHGSNDSLGNVLSPDAKRMRFLMAREVVNDQTMLAEAKRFGLEVGAEIRYHYYHRYKLRIVSWKLDAEGHPIPGESTLRLLRLLKPAVWHSPELTWRGKIGQTLWSLLLILSPRGLVSRMLDQNSTLRRVASERGLAATSAARARLEATVPHTP